MTRRDEANVTYRRKKGLIGKMLPMHKTENCWGLCKRKERRMSILIKGIDFPKGGWYLDLIITADGVVRCYGNEDEQIAEAIEIPDHGDLIDREALIATDSWEWIRHLAPVVIPAERSEE